MVIIKQLGRGRIRPYQAVAYKGIKYSPQVLGDSLDARRFMNKEITKVAVYSLILHLYLYSYFQENMEKMGKQKVFMPFNTNTGGSE